MVQDFNFKHSDSSIPSQKVPVFASWTTQAYEVADAGAFYTGRSWLQPGNVLTGNIFRSVRTRVPVFSAPSVQAVCECNVIRSPHPATSATSDAILLHFDQRVLPDEVTVCDRLCADLDDQMSGYTVTNNTFEDCQVGVFIGASRGFGVPQYSYAGQLPRCVLPSCPGLKSSRVGLLVQTGGGRSNKVLHNTMRNCDSAIHFDDRGHGCFSLKCFPNCPGNCAAMTIWGLVGNITTTGGKLPPDGSGKLVGLGPVFREYVTMPWLGRYPALSELLTVGTLGDPILNIIEGNRACGCARMLDAGRDDPAWFVHLVADEYMGVVRNNVNVTACFSSKPLLLATAAAAPPWATRPPPAAAWRLTFSEDFSDPENFTNHWTKSNNTIMNALDDDQTYFADNAAVRDGALVIETRQQTTTLAGRTTNFTSAWVTTQGYFSQKFGRFAFRAKLPNGSAPGIFPALWLMPESPAKVIYTGGPVVKLSLPLLNCG